MRSWIVVVAVGAACVGSAVLRAQEPSTELLTAAEWLVVSAGGQDTTYWQFDTTGAVRRWARYPSGTVWRDPAPGRWYWDASLAHTPGGTRRLCLLLPGELTTVSPKYRQVYCFTPRYDPETTPAPQLLWGTQVFHRVPPS